MRAVWSPSADSSGEPAVAQASGQALGPVVTAAAVLFNFALCFVNTNVVEVSGAVVVCTEITLIGTALALTWDYGSVLYDVLLAMAAYFTALMVLRAQFDPKIVRDLLIPIAFFFFGRRLGSLRSADRLVTFLIIVAFAVALFEWLAVSTYVRYFDVIHYYIARGTVSPTYSTVNGDDFFNSSRFDTRTLLPFLGDHRVSGVFLEAPSVGNFGAIVFAWVLLRDRQRFWVLLAKSVAIATIIVLADARFGLYYCLFALVLYRATALIRPTMLFAAPFFVVIALVIYADANWQAAWDNTISGRFLLAGRILANLDPWQIYGLLISNIKTGALFAMDPVTNSGYAYLLIQVGLVGMAAVWALFVYTPVHDGDTWRLKTFVAFYYIVLLTISASVFTIKTAALLWFLYGTLSNPNRAYTDGEPQVTA